MGEVIVSTADGIRSREFVTDFRLANDPDSIDQRMGGFLWDKPQQELIRGREDDG